MRCPNCKREIKRGQNFCQYCGTRIPPELDREPEKPKKSRILLPVGIGVLCIFWIVVLGIILVPKQTVASKLQEKLDLGNNYLEKADYVKAKAAFQEALSIDEKSPEADLGMADVYTAQKEPDQALKYLKKASTDLEAASQNKNPVNIPRDPDQFKSRYQQLCKDNSDYFDHSGDSDKSNELDNLWKHVHDIDIPIITNTPTPKPKKKITPTPDDGLEHGGVSKGGSTVTKTPTQGGTVTPNPGDSVTPNPGDSVTPLPGDTITPVPDNPITPEAGGDIPNPGDPVTPVPRDTITPTPVEDTVTPTPTDTVTPTPVEDTVTPTPTEAAEPEPDPGTPEIPEPEPDPGDPETPEPNPEDPEIPDADLYTTAQTPEEILEAYIQENISVQPEASFGGTSVDSFSAASVMNGRVGMKETDLDKDGDPELLAISVQGGRLSFTVYKVVNGAVQETANVTAVCDGMGTPLSDMTYGSTQECFIRDNGANYIVGFASYLYGADAGDGTPAARTSVEAYQINGDGSASRLCAATIQNGDAVYSDGNATTAQPGGQDLFAGMLGAAGLSGSWNAENADSLISMDLVNDPWQDMGCLPDPLAGGLNEPGTEDLVIINADMGAGTGVMSLGLQDNTSF